MLFDWSRTSRSQYNGTPFGITFKVPKALATTHAQGIKDQWSTSELLKAIDTASNLEKSLLPTGQFVINETTGNATALPEARARAKRPKVVVPLFNGDLDQVEQVPEPASAQKRSAAVVGSAAVTQEGPPRSPDIFDSLGGIIAEAVREKRTRRN